MGTNVAMATGGFYHEEAVTGEMPTKSPTGSATNDFVTNNCPCRR